MLKNNIWYDEISGKCIGTEDIECLPENYQIEALSETIPFVFSRGIEMLEAKEDILERIGMFLRLVKNTKALSFGYTTKTINATLFLLCNKPNLFNIRNERTEKLYKSFYEITKMIREVQTCKGVIEGERYWKEKIIDNICKESLRAAGNEDQSFIKERIEKIIEIFQIPKSDERIITALNRFQ